MAVSTLSKAFLGASARKVAFNPSAFFARPQLSLAVTSNQRAGSTMAVPKSSQMPAAQYGGRHTVTMIPGDGIGPEMMDYVKEVFTYAGVPVDFEMINFDPKSETSDDLNQAILSVKRNGCAIKGNIETVLARQDLKSRNVELRNSLDLFVNVLHCKSRQGVKTRHDNIDIILIRQNTEGEYAMLEHENVKGVVESLKIVTETNTERLCRFAFDHARLHGRSKVTLVHKANIMKITDGLFLSVGERVAKDYPDIKFNNMIIDNCCMQLVSNPWQFDVVILTNLYGNIVSNLVAGLIGGPGLIGGSNYGPQYAVFETGTRNAAQTLVGTKKANPIATLTASVEMLRHLGLDYHANVIKYAIDRTINFDKIHTPDLGGQYTADQVVENIIKYINQEIKIMF